MKKTILALDPVKHEPVLREMTEEERPLYFFGETVGILLFRPWYHCITTPGHISFAPTYDFPVRFKFVDDPFDPVGFHESSPEQKGWNLDGWIRAAQELQEEGVRAIVGGCGLTGMIQKELAAAVELPVYTSSMLFVPEVHETLAGGKRVGILTVSADQLTAHNKALFTGCDIDASIPVAVAGMNESADADIWLTMTTPAYNKDKVEQAVVNTALKLIKDYPDIGVFVLECTDMPPYSDAIRTATGLPVFDAVDMVNRVHSQVVD
ncbi:MAG: aspartate/glutamate racemase family protein [Woeseiaceae bacterium]